MIGLFQSGWHWPLVATIVVVGLAVVCVIVLEKPDREWLQDHRRQLRRAIWGGVALLAIALLVGQLHHLGGMLKRIQEGDPAWLAFGVGVESLSFVGYVVLTYAIFSPHAPRLGWSACVEITFGGVVATRLLSAGGAGGIAFTSWALRAAGMRARDVAKYIAAFLALLYAPYVAALGLGGLGGGVPDAVMWVGIGIAVTAVIAAIALTLIPGDLERRARQVAARKGRMAKLAARASSVPAIAGDSVRTALDLAREHPQLIAWALLWWGADVAVLDACFRAFGNSPALGVLILGYFLGHIGNFVPVPGGIGGVEGGMVGVFAACGVPLSLAVVGTIAYQVISTWLPVAPGLGAYVSLRRRVARWRAEGGEEPVPELTAAVGH